MINPQHAYRFTAFFANPALEQEVISQVSGALQNQWSELLATFITERLTHSRDEIEQLQVQADAMCAELYAEFTKSEAYGWAKQMLDSTFSWELGRCSLRVTARTAEPDKRFSSQWSFELPAPCVERIRRNVAPAIAELSGWPNRSYEGCTIDYVRKDSMDTYRTL